MQIPGGSFVVERSARWPVVMWFLWSFVLDLALSGILCSPELSSRKTDGVKETIGIGKGYCISSTSFGIRA